MNRDDERACIVTGAAQGIGREISRRLVAEGWRVMLADVQEKVAAAAADLGGAAAWHLADVGDEGQAAGLVRAAAERFGRLDGIVNNAGIMRHAPPGELGLADWQRVLATNLTGPFLLSRHAAPHLARHGGAIVNIASTRALMSEPDSEAYAASKAGLVGLTHALAASLGPEVRVNCISPGWIETGDYQQLRPEDHAQHPAGRVGRPEDVAALAYFLLSGESGFITGQNYVLDGGMTRKMIYVP